MTVTLVAVIEAALMVDTPRVETFNVVDPRFAVPETVKLAMDRA